MAGYACSGTYTLNGHRLQRGPFPGTRPASAGIDRPGRHRARRPGAALHARPGGRRARVVAGLHRSGDPARRAGGCWSGCVIRRRRHRAGLDAARAAPNGTCPPDREDRRGSLSPCPAAILTLSTAVSARVGLLATLHRRAEQLHAEAGRAGREEPRRPHLRRRSGPTTVPEIEAAIKRADDKERLIGLLAAPFAAAIGLLITAAWWPTTPRPSRQRPGQQAAREPVALRRARRWWPWPWRC